MTFKYPNVRRDETVKDVYNGVEVRCTYICLINMMLDFLLQVADPYRWLEDPDSEETNAFVEAQNEITRPYIDGCPFKEKIKDTLTNLWNYPKVSHPSRYGKKYFQYRNTGLQNQNVMYVLDDSRSEGEVFLDPNLFSDDGTVALTCTAFSESGDVLAYGLSESGSDWLQIKFRSTDKGKFYYVKIYVF